MGAWEHGRQRGKAAGGLEAQRLGGPDKAALVDPLNSWPVGQKVQMRGTEDQRLG